MVLSFVWLVSMLRIVNMTAMVSFVRCVSVSDPALPTLLCGDFNMILDRVVSRCGWCPFDISRKSFDMLSMLFWVVVLRIFGVKCIPVFLRLLGVSLMRPLPQAFTLSVARIFGCLM